MQYREDKQLLKQSLKSLKYDLHFFRIEDYQKLLYEIIITLKHSTITSNYKKSITSTLGQILQIFKTRHPSHSDIIDHIDDISQLRGMTIEQQKVYTTVNKQVINDVQRQQIKLLYNINKPGPGIAYRGNLARIIARYARGIPIIAADTTFDTDIYADGTQYTVLTLAQQLNIDPQGIQLISGSRDTIMPQLLAQVDISMNQLAVTESCLYYTQAAYDDLCARRASLTAQGTYFLGPTNFEVNGHIVHTGRLVMRLIKVLVQQKADSIILPSHFLDRQNQAMIDLPKHLLTLVRKTLTTPSSQYYQEFYILDAVAKQINIILPEENIFDHIYKRLQEHPEYNMQKMPETPQAYANRLVKKIRNNAEHMIDQQNNYNPYANYQYQEGDTVIQKPQIHYNKAFTKRLEEFLIQVQEITQNQLLGPHHSPHPQ